MIRSRMGAQRDHSFNDNEDEVTYNLLSDGSTSPEKLGLASVNRGRMKDFENDHTALGGLQDPVEAKEGSLYLSVSKCFQYQPVWYGYLHKKKVTLWNSLFQCCCKARWKRRYFILIGDYLIRYEKEDGLQIKGMPINLRNAEFRKCTREESEERGREYCFIVSTIRKEFILSCENDITRTTWLNHLRVRKQEIIKESLGHRKPNPAHIEVNKIITKKYENLWNMKFASSGAESKGNFYEGSIEMQNMVMNPGI